jgi:hypothetical protein
MTPKVSVKPDAHCSATNFLQPPSVFDNRDEAGSQDHRLSIGLQADASVKVEEDEIRPLRA